VGVSGVGGPALIVADALRFSIMGSGGVDVGGAVLSVINGTEGSLRCSKGVSNFVRSSTSAKHGGQFEPSVYVRELPAKYVPNEFSFSMLAERPQGVVSRTNFLEWRVFNFFETISQPPVFLI